MEDSAVVCRWFSLAGVTLVRVNIWHTRGKRWQKRVGIWEFSQYGIVFVGSFTFLLIIKIFLKSWNYCRFTAWYNAVVFMRCVQHHGWDIDIDVHACMLSCFSRVSLFATLRILPCQAPLSVEFSRQEYWSGLPCPSPGDLPNPRIESTSLTSSALGGRFFTHWATWEACWPCYVKINSFSITKKVLCLVLLYPHPLPPAPTPSFASSYH